MLAFRLSIAAKPHMLELAVVVQIFGSSCTSKLSRVFTISEQNSYFLDLNFKFLWQFALIIMYDNIVSMLLGVFECRIFLVVNRKTE